MTRKIIRCVACARRIRDSHPHIGVEDLATGVEFNYHARPACMRRAVEETARRTRRGTVYIWHHYHVCGDYASGFRCRGGCFAGGEAA
jgi:hypothetical protein